ncbi:MAG: hypothetical protein CMI76_03140 [Candidatus Pelagibacter sp.]|nr:hypothetical protein [Candidatus Pelagibacter sp.]|tara:strand:- start:666 stop:2084 length:1419 start_codon:yes stop_codon:yes gene_type:complete
MFSGINYAGEFNIQELKLFASSGNVVDLSGSYISMNLFEDIFSPSLTGDVTVVDTNAILMNAPITGQDFLSFKIITPSLEKRGIDFTETVMSIYKIDTRIQPSTGSEVFTLHFCSPEGLRDSRTRVSKSYADSIDTIVEDLLTNKFYINSRKDLFIEQTSGIRKIVAPNHHPFRIINHLKREAIGQYNNSPNFLFFENLYGIHFRSLDSLYAQKDIGQFHSGDRGTIDKKEGGVTNVAYELKRVLDYQFNANNDTLKNIRGGMLASNIITHNIFNKNYATKTFDYVDNFNDFNRVNYNNKSKDNPIYNDVPLDEFDNTISEFTNSRIHLHPTSTDGLHDAQHYFEFTDGEKNIYSPNNIDKTHLTRQSKYMELSKGSSITMEINGTTTISAGNMIEFNMPISGVQHGKDKIDKYYSGRYLISSTRHMFDQATRKHTILMTIVKDSLNNKLPKNDLAIEPKGKKGIVVNSFYS